MSPTPVKIITSQPTTRQGDSAAKKSIPQAPRTTEDAKLAYVIRMGSSTYCYVIHASRCLTLRRPTVYYPDMYPWPSNSERGRLTEINHGCCPLPEVKPLPHEHFLGVGDTSQQGRHIPSPTASNPPAHNPSLQETATHPGACRIKQSGLRAASDFAECAQHCTVLYRATIA